MAVMRFSSIQDGLTAIDHAAFLGHKKITAFLLEQNAETSKKSPVSSPNINSLNVKCACGCHSRERDQRNNLHQVL